MGYENGPTLAPEQLVSLNREQLVEHVRQLQDRLTGLSEALEMQKITDSLTGLANRDYYFASLNRLCCRARRFDQVVCMALIDIDNFRDINEQFGTLAGDLVLTGLADLLRSAVRNYDLLARFGEDEFAIAIDNANTDIAEQLGRRLRSAVAGNPFCANDRILPVTVTVGVASARAESLGDRPDNLVRAAIEAVELAHRKGQSQWHYIDLDGSAAQPGRQT